MEETKPKIRRPPSTPPTFFQHLTTVTKRAISTILLIVMFILVILSGPLTLIFLGLTIQVSSFREVLNIVCKSNKIPPNIPYYKYICWYFLITANYYFAAGTIAPHFDEYLEKSHHLQIMVKYHRFICFCVYFAGTTFFFISSRRESYSRLFKILAWTHTLLIILVAQVYMVLEIGFFGIIWQVLPSCLVILNDIFAYIFGRFWGKTPLIQLSPKKTWEGFIGGGISTVIGAFFLSNFLCHYDYFVCPAEYHNNGFHYNCTTDYLFTPKKFFFGGETSLDFYPFTYHALIFAVFASVIAPFGGFFASGFKRAFKVKNFGEIIPGHGGIMDRFDCQFLMFTFVNVYVYTFVKNRYTVDAIFSKFAQMDEKNQLHFYYLMKNSLEMNLG